MEKLVYLVRHGESEANISGVFQGPDAELTARGREQAQFLAERLRTVNAEVILTSPMPRAHDTALAVRAATRLPLETHDILREYVPPSSLIGKPESDPHGQEYVQGMRERYADPSWRFEDEDTYFDLHARACDVLRMLEERSEERLVVVSHAGFLRAVLVAMMTDGEPDPHLMHRLRRFLRPSNTGISLCRLRTDSGWRNKWRLLIWNDAAHLGETWRTEPSVQDDISD